MLDEWIPAVVPLPRHCWSQLAVDRGESLVTQRPVTTIDTFRGQR